MKQIEVITIEKLKTIVDKDKQGRNATKTINSSKINPSNHNCRKNKCFNTMFSCLMYILEPLLPSDGTKSDGRIASVVYLICLTTAGIVMNITASLQNDSNVIGITTDHIDGFIITCICPALVWIAYIFYKQNDRKTVDFISIMPHSHRPLMAGAYVFGAGSSVMDILHISFYLHCTKNLSNLFFSLFKAMFILIQILFLRKFSCATLHKSQNIRLVIFHILGTNICIWFRALFDHGKFLLSPDLDNDTTSLKTLCWNDDEPMAKIWTSSEPYLYPFTMEYCLIAGGMLYTMWSEMRDLDPDPQDIYIYDEMGDDSKDEKIKNIHDDDSSGYLGSLGGGYSLSRSASRASLYSQVSKHSMCRSCHETTQEDVLDTYKPSSDPGFLLGILMSTLLFISIAFLWMDQKSQHALRFYYLYQIVLHAVATLCLWLILKGLQTQISAWYPYNSDDSLLIVSFTGVFLYTGLSFTAAITEFKRFDSIAVYSIVKSSLILIESILQVTAIIKAIRFRPYFKNGNHVDIIRQGVLFLLTTNIALWGQDSFFELRNMLTTPVQQKLFGETYWRAITIFAYPLCIFFRFHSAACLFEVWSSFR